MVVVTLPLRLDSGYTFVLRSTGYSSLVHLRAFGSTFLYLGYYFIRSCGYLLPLRSFGSAHGSPHFGYICRGYRSHIAVCTRCTFARSFTHTHRFTLHCLLRSHCGYGSRTRYTACHHRLVGWLPAVYAHTARFTGYRLVCALRLRLRSLRPRGSRFVTAAACSSHFRFGYLPVTHVPVTACLRSPFTTCTHCRIAAWITGSATRLPLVPLVTRSRLRFCWLPFAGCLGSCCHTRGWLQVAVTGWILPVGSICLVGFCSSVPVPVLRIHGYYVLGSGSRLHVTAAYAVLGLHTVGLRLRWMRLYTRSVTALPAVTVYYHGSTWFAYTVCCHAVYHYTAGSRVLWFWLGLRFTACGCTFTRATRTPGLPFGWFAPLPTRCRLPFTHGCHGLRLLPRSFGYVWLPVTHICYRTLPFRLPRCTRCHTVTRTHTRLVAFAFMPHFGSGYHTGCILYTMRLLSLRLRGYRTVTGWLHTRYAHYGLHVLPFTRFTFTRL